MNALRPLLWAALAGLVVGAALDVLTGLMLSFGPTGDQWSFRGNGALIVPLGLGAAALAGGWIAVALYARGARAWIFIGFVVGVGAAVPALLSVVVLALFGSAAQTVSDLLTIPAFAWPAFLIALAVTLQFRPTVDRRLSAAFAMLAGVVFTVALNAGFMGAEAMLYPGSA